ncbi:MAG: hypothetical protein AB9846_08555 [Tenuifilaceae bacterium]
MKTNNLIYILSLIFLAGSVFLVVTYPNSGRIYLIAGGLTLIGFALNILGFVMKNNK